MAKPKTVRFTIEVEMPPGYDNRMMTKIVKPEVEFEVKKYVTDKGGKLLSCAMTKV